MNKYPLIGGSICAVVLIVLSSSSSVVGYRTDITENRTSLAEGSPDLTILRVVDDYNMDWGCHLDFIIQNIGDAPTQAYTFAADVYLFGLIPLGGGEGSSGSLDPGKTATLPVTSFGDAAEPPPFIGLVRVRCSVYTDNEKDYSNNYYAHSYFIMKVWIYWVFKELPW
jgi:hypothetical protein